MSGNMCHQENRDNPRTKVVDLGDVSHYPPLATNGVSDMSDWEVIYWIAALAIIGMLGIGWAQP